MMAGAAGLNAERAPALLQAGPFCDLLFSVWHVLGWHVGWPCSRMSKSWCWPGMPGAVRGHGPAQEWRKVVEPAVRAGYCFLVTRYTCY